MHYHVLSVLPIAQNVPILHQPAPYAKMLITQFQLALLRLAHQPSLKILTALAEIVRQHAAVATEEVVMNA